MNNYIQTLSEEKANTISHGAMAALILLALPFAAIWAYTHYGLVAAFTVSIYVISIFLMFMSSTVYHVMSPNTTHKLVTNVLDHSMIYIAIAGTYTPIAINTIGGWQGIVIVSIQWTMAILGVVYKSVAINKFPKLSLIIYLVMGWVMVIFIVPFVRNAPWQLMMFILIGGALYSIGSVFYAKKGWFRYHHLVWHIFINLAMATHFVGVVFFLK